MVMKASLWLAARSQMKPLSSLVLTDKVLLHHLLRMLLRQALTLQGVSEQLPAPHAQGVT